MPFVMEVSSVARRRATKGEGQLKAAAKDYSMNSRNGDQGRGVEGIKDPVNPFQERPHALGPLLAAQSLKAMVKLAQICASTEA